MISTQPYDQNYEHVSLPWRPGSPCPCESGKAYKECCLQADGVTPRVILPTLVPEDPLTGYANPGCYLKHTNNCSKRMSREHYISRCVLEVTKTFGLRGLPWQDPNEEVVDYGIESLAARILCERHNSALSPLDAMAARVYRIIMQIRDDLANRTRYDRGRWFIASGEALELWTLKTLYGIYFAKIAATESRQRLIESHEINLELLDRAIQRDPLPENCGMWVRPPTMGKIPSYVQVAPLTFASVAEQRIVGIRARVFLIEVDTIIDPVGVGFVDRANKRHCFRPWLLKFSNNWRTHRLLLTWQGNMQNVGILSYSLEADPNSSTPAPPMEGAH